MEFARIAVGEGQPLHCVHCSSPAERSYRDAATIGAEVDRAAAASADPTGPNVCLTGPEPFGHPELPRLGIACRQAGARRIALETDAAALSVRVNAAGLVAAGVHHLHVRILHADEARGDELGGGACRTRDSFAGIAGYLEAAEAAGVNAVVTLRVPVCEHNAASLPEIVTRAAALGVHAVRLLGTDRWPPSAPAFIGAACDTGMVNGVWVEAAESLPVPDSHSLHIVGGGCDE